MINQNYLKKKLAEKAIKYIPYGSVLGIGTGSTINFFINELKKIQNKVSFIISSSHISTEKMSSLNIPVNHIQTELPEIDIYIDSADEINSSFQMIKGGGGALTKEKIIATFAKKFFCIIDHSKEVKNLGSFPVAVEVIPIAKNLVIKELKKIGGISKLRKDFITDNGNIIIDVYDLNINNPKKIESYINKITGVVENGIFAYRSADMVLVSTPNGVLKKEQIIY